MKTMFLAALIIVTAFLGAPVSAKSVKLKSYEVVNLNLSKEIFAFKEALVFFEKTDETASLHILNVICPQKEGQINCKATPMTALQRTFKLSAPSEKDSSCGITTQTSDWILDGMLRHQLVVRNFADADKLNCLLQDVDYAVELHTELLETNTIHISSIDVKKFTYEPTVPQVKNYVLESASAKYTGPFFKNNKPDLVTLTVDLTNLKAHLRMTDDPCGPSTNGINICLAMPRVILAKSFDIQPEVVTLDKPFCNDFKYASEKVSLGEVVNTVLGAKRNRAAVAIHDALEATCDLDNKGYLTLDLLVENFSKFGAGKEVINSRSRAKLRFVALETPMSELK